IIAIHQPVYSISKRRNNADFQELLVPVFDRFSVDLVLQGHDHGYSRTFPLKNNKPVSDKEKGTIYIISNAGPKFYPASSRYDHLMAKIGRRKLLFQSIRVDTDTLQYTSYNIMNKVFDTFTINR
ncbi:MAG: phosphohydrolase, partial [Desulfobacula sp.]|nr:phosphohydrolase [Desulfobacula sp.]